MSESRTIKKKKRWGKIYEYTPTVRLSVLTPELAEEIQKELENTSGVTPQSLALKHGIKVSLAKKILQKMVKKGKLKLVHSNSKNKIYSNK